jgi:mitofilin
VSGDRDKNEHKGNNVYPADLPIGFEPPPGYARPKSVPPSKAAQSSAEVEIKPEPLPLVAPAVADLTSSEPILAHLASTIDQLASFLNDNPSAAGKARGVLDTAKVDVTRLAEHIEAVKLEERDKLEAKLNEQVHEYTIKLLELEMEAQDKLDGQEQEFKEFFEQERRTFVQAYRQKLDNELRAQSEIINERCRNFCFIHCPI